MGSRRTVAVAALAVAVVAIPGTAAAAFSGSAKAGLSIGSASLGGPGTVSTSKKCTLLGLGGDTITANWSASTDQHVAGYTLYLDANTGSDVAKSVSGRTTTSATVSVTAGATYSLTVSSTYLNWTTTSSATTVSCGLLG